MSIEFTCLNCRHRIVADDVDVGAKVDCPECGLTVKVPAPIGGKLTGKRIPPQDVPPLLSPNYQGHSLPAPLPSLAPRPTVPTGPKKRTYTVPAEPNHNFAFDYAFDGVLGRDEEDAAADVMVDVAHDLLDHFRTQSQYYTSCGLLLLVFKFSTDEVVVRLMGSVNREAIQQDVRINLIVQNRNGMLTGLGGALGVLIADAAFSSSTRSPQQVAKQVLSPMVKQMTQFLDEHVGVPRSWWRMW